MNKNRFYEAVDLLDDATEVYVVEENEIDKMNHTECRDINGELTISKDPNLVFEISEMVRDVQLKYLKWMQKRLYQILDRLYLKIDIQSKSRHMKYKIIALVKK